MLPFSTVQPILLEFVKDNKFKIDKEMIRNFVAFSMTGDNVDYRMLLDNFKERNERIVEFPKRNFF